jgi:dTDP-4-dehydrorhamnose reductase
MNVVVLGAKGMLGTDLMAALASAGINAAGYDLPELDITSDRGGMEKISRCDWLINCAAYTDVDGAEKDGKKAFAINRDGVKRIAEWCRKNGTALMHISTDYIFDGTRKADYTEDVTPNPLNVYGRSKLDGEKEVLAGGVKYLIVRTQSLFGVNGRNFVQAILSRLKDGAGPLKVVSDQVSSPTYTVHLADAILRLLKAGKEGIVNVSASDSCSWYEFACAIATRARPGAEILPVTSEEYVRPARRPANSVLDKARYEGWTGHKMPSWEQGLKEYMEKI